MAFVTTNPPTGDLTLTQACTALWMATLSLMTAFMQTQAPAHRYLLARRIARNFHTLREERCFSSESRVMFSRLAQRWSSRADQLAADDSGGVVARRKLIRSL